VEPRSAGPRAGGRAACARVSASIRPCCFIKRLAEATPPLRADVLAFAEATDGALKDALRFFPGAILLLTPAANPKDRDLAKRLVKKPLTSSITRRPCNNLAASESASFFKGNGRRLHLPRSKARRLRRAPQTTRQSITTTQQGLLCSSIYINTNNEMNEMRT
jgi:hypothetical protein